MSENIYGYVRVSTKDQNLDRQVLAMQEFGIPDKQIWQEKLSGKDFERPVYLRLLKKIKPGDTLVIKSIDRLGRNYNEILEQWRIYRKGKRRCHCSTGHAYPGYTSRERPDRDIDCGYCFTASQLCSPN